MTNYEKLKQKIQEDVPSTVGKEPMLNDVLKWMIITTEPCLQFEQDVINFISIWDLSKPYLKDQSQELIDLLVGIGS